MSYTCDHCCDEHQLTIGRSDGVVEAHACTDCPIPCDNCRQLGVGAYCEITPCPCPCHLSPQPAVNYGAVCPNHGEVKTCDEDGCCPSCGSQVIGDGIDEVLRERDQLRADNKRLRAMLPNA